MFVQVGNKWIAVGDIKSISYQQNGDGIIQTADELFPAVPRYVVDRLTDEHVAHVMPANPGTYVVGVDEEAKSMSEIVLWPIIGWAVTSSGTTYSIGVDGVESGNADRLILHPDGRVQSASTVYPDIRTAVEMERKIILAD
ncbi:hypothetical protein L6Q21_10285 [Sandaracinobacter sp. RS1-74]|uniref:hypothetical protein n=1 Tax=Sandaracinobacteroides sayramensis TaxID=2913411 RepID=UPI001EDC0799|nr:hypothetical protein [Sandaracinobacteroides sayramensis]MCG2841368.1 hypothetical protein [Sandaracinobacteroides sayramensis]